MSHLLDELSEDHKNVARLLKLLGRQLDAVAAADDADIELMIDAMRYMTGYPDRVHHPKEDLMFERLLDRDPDSADIVEHLRGQHEELAELGQAFLHTVQLVCDGSMVEREAFEETGRKYVELLRDHMREENEIAFPLARDMLTEEDWAYASDAFAGARDPIFGGIADQSFKELLEHIDRMDA
ncbi:MAG: hemerythrin domain-containing protein [Gammaproteobacteria bacterium]